MLRIYPLHCYFPDGGRLLSGLALLAVTVLYFVVLVLHASGYDGVDTARWTITFLATAALMFRLAGEVRDLAMCCE
ncbi:hypothetical protein Forpe1208_v014566 [Fusarium oxysporum f. sp. rapae]|uniref:Uncharacterized protein n=1 Tax=Fusarium oxysporum f. sp. rapae TaxID=485398 RepID=A0A8J5NF11_FUSOX|nr:hypothetical protein Forpe1208_v014566 [Fusarium oxysporum f. sp. rapae]